MDPALDVVVMSGIMIFAFATVGLLGAWIGWQARYVLPWWPIMRTDERQRREFISQRRKSSGDEGF